MKDYINDEEHFIEIQEFDEQVRKKNFKKLGMLNEGQAAQNNDPLKNLKVIVQYVKGSYFGDSDIFAERYGLSNTGRDTTAISHSNTTLFVMNITVLDKIKADFYQIYQEMKELGIQRYKYHFIKIQKKIDKFSSAFKDMKQEMLDQMVLSEIEEE